MAHLSLSFLGPFQATLDGRPVTGFESAKVRALLAYLAVEADHPHPRESVAALLWPDWPQPSALRNLREALTNLRKTLGEAERPFPSDEAPPFLHTDRQALRFNTESDYDLDVDELAAAARKASALDARDALGEATLMQRAAGLYRGPFVEGLFVDSAPLEQWITYQRERVARDYLAILRALTVWHERSGDCDQALAYARQQVEIEPLDEEGHRQFMRALALSGQRNAALAHYQVCRDLLARELGVEPAAETTALYEQIRQGALVAPLYTPSPRVHESPLLPLSASPGLPVTESPHPLFVAREQELAHLGRWLGEALRGQGRVGFVVGEPGSGKTMLLREFARRAIEVHAELIVAGGGCNAYSGLGDPHLPFVETLRLLMGDVEAQYAAGSLSREAAGRLRGAAPEALQTVLREGQALIHVLIPGATLLEVARGLPDGARWEARVQDALDHRVAAPSQAFLYDQATHVLQALARHHPLLLILDDLQWSDTASISLLFHLGRRLAGQRILILGAYRPEEVAAGREGQPHPLAPVVLELGALWEENEVNLSGAEGRAFVQALVDSEPNRLGPAFREALYHHTGGHALFTVELLRGLQQRGDLLRDAEGRWVEGPSLDWDHLPRRVEAVIAAHIARLPPEEQELLSVASVEGEEFHAEVAAHVLKRDAEYVLASLSGAMSQQHRLVSAQSLRRVGEQRFSRYRFRHYLFQQYLHGQLDPVRRAHLHGEVANALEALGAGASSLANITDILEILADSREDLLANPAPIASEATMAWHWEEAGEMEKAALYHIHAGRRANMFSFDWGEVLSRFAKALALLETLPTSVQRILLKQSCYHALAVFQAMTRSWTIPEVRWAGQKALDLAEQSGDRLLIADALAWLRWAYQARGELDGALSLAERAVALAQGGPPGWVTWVEGSLAYVLLDRGEFARATQLLTPLVEALLRTGSIPPPWTNIQMVELAPWALWCLGRPDQALKVGRAAVALIEREKDNFQIGTGVTLICDVICLPHQLRREPEAVEKGLSLLRPAVEKGRCAPVILPIIAMLEGWVHAHSGSLERSIVEMQEALAEWSQRWMRMRPFYKGQIAEALARAGRVGEGLSLLEEALEQVERTGERWNEAELRRLKGELLLQWPSSPALLPQRAWEKGEKETVVAVSCRASADEAEGCFRQAIAVARGQEARSWELRATTSLARLLQSQGRIDEAREMLSAIYGWFTEGFDTPDLLDAKALLEHMTTNREEDANRGR